MTFVVRPLSSAPTELLLRINCTALALARQGDTGPRASQAPARIARLSAMLGAGPRKLNVNFLANTGKAKLRGPTG